ncbi:MAG: succinate dehydrogenase, cytochrome b556 subunit [Sphingopyxis sp.]
MPAESQRPLSPHLQVYKWGPAMLVSILHRATGDGLAMVGVMVFLWWLGAAASGAEAYTAFIGHASAWYGQVVLIGLTWAFFQHAASGLRHLLLDTGTGYELKSNRMWSIVVAAVPVILTAALWLFLYYKAL